MSYILDFFKTLNDSQIQYCHWKSTTYLQDAIDGKTDLDLLVGARHRARFEYICNNKAFKRVLSLPKKTYPGVYDYLGLDEELGTLHHLHIHYKLILGEQGVKNYWLPIEEFILARTILRQGIRVPIPEIELFLLILRIALKTRTTDILRGLVKPHAPIVPKQILYELKVLWTQSNKSEFKKIVLTSGTNIPLDLFSQAIDVYNSQNPVRLFILRTKVFRIFAKYRRHGFLLSKLRIGHSFISNRFHKFLRPNKKFLKQRKTIAIIGADGAGKSTLVHHISAWLAELLYVHSPYYGIPKTRIIKTYYLLLSILLKLEKSAEQLLPTLSKPLTRLTAYPKASFWLTVAILRNRTFRKAAKLANRGYLIISDRYPLQMFDNLLTEPMDRPMIHTLPNDTRSPILEWLAKKETQLHDTIAPPDDIIKLNVSLRVAVQRANEPNLPLSSHNQKIKAVASITSLKSLATINADQPLEKVIQETKRAIWHII